MRRLLHVAVVLCGLAVVALAPAVALAGENRYLGAIVSTGATVNNSTTAAPFVIPPGSKLTLYCDASGRLLTDSTTVAASGATKGVPVAATTLFPTSVGTQASATISSTRSALIAWISTTGTATCDVWQRLGTE